MTEKVVLLFSDTSINDSGLLKCCLATIHEYVEERVTKKLPNEPLVISCRHETYLDSENIVLEHGVWRWNHEV